MPLAMPVEKGSSQNWLCMGLFHFVCDSTKNEEVHCIVTEIMQDIFALH